MTNNNGEEKKTIVPASYLSLVLICLISCESVLKPLTKIMNWEVPLLICAQTGYKVQSTIVFSKWKHSAIFAKKVII